MLLNLNHNNPEYSVSEFSNLLKRVVETNFDFVRIRGEISGLKIAPSGHVYLNLKDEGSLIAAVCWKGVYGRIAVKLEEGLEVVCSGSITTYGGQSKYQLIVENIEPAGMGALMALFLKRKEEMEKEGLFDASRKQKLPYLPKIIGIITSPTGAVIKDMLHRISDRFPTKIMLWPVLVQGDQAAGQIAAAINGFNNYSEQGAIPRPDIIIVARGGGSIEDLWAFNEEIVVRATANSKIPIISAVGHETDTTLIDYASDVRAPTPTAAAEMAVPVHCDLVITLDDLSFRLNNSARNLIDQKLQYINHLIKAVPNFYQLASHYQQRTDDILIRLHQILPKIIIIKSSNLQKIAFNIRDPYNLLQQKFNSIDILKIQMVQVVSKLYVAKDHFLALYSQNLQPTILTKDYTYKFEKMALLLNKINLAYTNIIIKYDDKFNNLLDLLNSYHYERVLDRGFAIAFDINNKIITSCNNLNNDDILNIQFKDGKVKVKVIYD